VADYFKRIVKTPLRVRAINENIKGLGLRDDLHPITLLRTNNSASALAGPDRLYEKKSQNNQNALGLQNIERWPF
jgi:hypothetical protein